MGQSSGTSSRPQRAALIPDAGPTVGLGHVGRCVALAQALAAVGWDAGLVLIDADAKRFTRRNGIRTVSTVPRARVLVVLDTYDRPAARARALRTAGHDVVVIDDLHLVTSDDADIVVRPSLGERESGLVLAGGQYVLLRREFWRRSPRARRPEVRRILVALGGYPRSDLVDAVTTALRDSLPEALLEVVGATGARDDRHIRGIGHVPSLLPALRRADLAVTAGGQTMNEALAAGVPTIVLGTAENQRRNVAAVRRFDVAVAIGSFDDPRWRSRLSAAVRALAADRARRDELARHARAALDGEGALRLARALTRRRATQTEP